VAGRLRQSGIRARTIELRIRSSDFRTRHRALALPEATDLTDPLWQCARQIFERSLTGDLLPVRLLGVGATRLTRDAAVQGDLFDAGQRARHQALDRTGDAIRRQFGTAAL
jgi:DNA polymerase-4